MGLRSGGFGAKPRTGDRMEAPWKSKGDKPMDKPEEKSEGRHIHVHSHNGKITSHSTDEHGMQQEGEHGDASEAADHVRNFLSEGDDRPEPSTNNQPPQSSGHYGLMA